MYGATYERLRHNIRALHPALDAWMIVEGYDGLAIVRSLVGGRGEIEWLLGEGMEEEAAALAERLQREVGLCPIERPSDWIDLAGPEPA